MCFEFFVYFDGMIPSVLSSPRLSHARRISVPGRHTRPLQRSLLQAVVSLPGREIGARRRLRLHGRTLPMPRQDWQCPHGESVRTPHEDGGNSTVARADTWSCSWCDIARNFAGKQRCHECGEPRGRRQESLTSANQRERARRVARSTNRVEMQPSGQTPKASLHNVGQGCP